MPKQETIFRISGNNRGLVCPFMAIVCEVGYCQQCQIYLDWQRKGEFLVLCAWCGEVLRRNPDHGKPVVSHGICPECKQKYFPEASESVKE